MIVLIQIVMDRVFMDTMEMMEKLIGIQRTIILIVPLQPRRMMINGL